MADFYNASYLPGIIQRGMDQALNVAQMGAQQPRPADIFLERLRQARQDKMREGQVGLAQMLQLARLENTAQGAQIKAHEAETKRMRAEAYAALGNERNRLIAEATELRRLQGQARDENEKARISAMIAEREAAARLADERARGLGQLHEQQVDEYGNYIPGSSLNERQAEANIGLTGAKGWRAGHYLPGVVPAGPGGQPTNLKYQEMWMKHADLLRKRHAAEVGQRNKQNFQAAVMSGKMSEFVPEDPSLTDEQVNERLGLLLGGALTPQQPRQNAPKKPGAKNALELGPSAGDIEDGYRFLGGDPADPNSWEEEPGDLGPMD